MGRASSQPKSLSISSSAPSSRPFSGAAGPAPTRLNISSKTLFSFSTAPFPLSFTRPKVVRWSNSTTRMTRFATSARNIDSFSPWCTREANSGSPIILASWSLALKSAAVREAKAVESNWGGSPTVATSCPVRSTSRAQRAFASRRNACRCCWINLKSFSENDQLAAHAIQRAEPSPEHVVATPEAPGALDGPDISRLLHHAQHRGIPSRVGADRARILVGQVAAGAARRDPVPHPANGIGQAPGGFRRLLQQGKREALRRLATDPGELGELRHEIFDGRHGELQRQLKRKRQR